MLARILEYFGGVVLAVGLCLGLFLRFPNRGQYLPESIASMEVAIGIAFSGAVLILAARLL
jgi:hypothetical protein